MGKHVVDQGVEVVARTPSPVAASLCIVHALRPAVGNSLAKVRLVVHGEPWHAPCDGRTKLCGTEVHRCHVVAGMHAQRLLGSRHQLQGGANGVFHVHHRQAGIGAQKTRVAPVAPSRMKNINCVVGGSSARRRLPRNQSRVAQRAHVHTEFLAVVLAPEFAGELADAIDRGRVHDGVLRRVQARSGRSKGGNRRGPKHAIEQALFGHVEHDEQGVHVEGPGLGGHFLARGTEHGHELVDLANSLALHQGAYRYRVGGVQGHSRLG